MPEHPPAGRRRTTGRERRAACGRLLAPVGSFLKAGLIAVGWIWAAYPLHPYAQELLEPVLEEPPTGHPERLAPDDPPTPEERALWRDLGRLTARLLP
ncbi:DUF6059 family protein [Kitasatospora phosalacinea]|uniref:DUF6059 family protein n=1 Tax=Kitasatospora phosalacinea TaxID=2065 RepID=UPI0012FEA3F7|nr:DUF6059 family protein [Kitasatospora phosalacinea]